MSSMSLHFWHAEPDEVRRALAAQHAAGRIVAANGQWVCFVPFDPSDEQKIIPRSRGLVLKWTYYEDYAINLEFFDDGERLGQASFIWGVELAGHAPTASVPPQLGSKLRGIGLAASVDQRERLAPRVATGVMDPEEVRDCAARALGLAAHECLSPQTCLDMPLDEFRSDYPEAEDVDYPE